MDYYSTTAVMDYLHIERFQMIVTPKITSNSSDRVYLPCNIWTSTRKYFCLGYTEPSAWKVAQPGGYAKQAMREGISEITEHNADHATKIECVYGVVMTGDSVACGRKSLPIRIKNVSVLVVFLPDGNQNVIIFGIDPENDRMMDDRYIKQVDEIVIPLHQNVSGNGNVIYEGKRNSS